MPHSSEPPLHDIQLDEAWLAGVEFRENQDFDLAILDQGLTYTVGSESSAWLDPFVGSGLRTTVEWQDKESEPCDGPFHLMVAVHGSYAVPGRTAQDRGEHLEQWLNFMGPYLLWPYARSYVSSLTSLSQFPPLTLFTLVMPRPRALEEASAAEAPFSDPAYPGATPESA